jgi:hypothetical protein
VRTRRDAKRPDGGVVGSTGIHETVCFLGQFDPVYAPRYDLDPFLHKFSMLPQLIELSFRQRKPAGPI